jgi:hypothetical protein
MAKQWPAFDKTILQKIKWFWWNARLYDLIFIYGALLDEIKIQFAYHVPADNYYRVNNMSAIKNRKFYTNNVRY